jgi:hypothetical protein
MRAKATWAREQLTVLAGDRFHAWAFVRAGAAYVASQLVDYPLPLVTSARTRDARFVCCTTKRRLRLRRAQERG